MKRILRVEGKSVQEKARVTPVFNLYRPQTQGKMNKKYFAFRIDFGRETKHRTREDRSINEVL